MTHTLANQASPQRLTASLLIVIPLLFVTLFALLGSLFDYPDILRAETGQVFARYQAGGILLKAAWYGMLICALAFIPLSLLVGRTLFKDSRSALPVMLVGSLAGLVQAIGFARWVFVMPYLSDQYGQATAEVQVVFGMLNQFAGVGLGEHLGYLFTGTWTLLLARSEQLRGTLYGQVGMLLGVGILMGMLEAAGLAFAPVIVSISYLLWALWMVALGVRLLRQK